MANINEKKKYHYLYKTVNLTNDEYYVGIHSTSNLRDGYLGSGKRLISCLNKYGRHNFKLYILEWFDNRKDLLAREAEVVSNELLKDSKCINLRPGGSGGWCNDKHRRIATLAANSKRLHMLSNDANFKERFSKACSESNKKQYRNGTRTTKPPNWKGKKHSSDTINKMRESKKGSGTGETNSQYGTYWITNGKENKKIKLDSEIPIGWHKGRVCNNSAKLIVTE